LIEIDPAEPLLAASPVERRRDPEAPDDDIPDATETWPEESPAIDATETSPLALEPDPLVTCTRPPWPYNESPPDISTALPVLSESVPPP
jgi:hypothetical protein